MCVIIKKILVLTGDGDELKVIVSRGCTAEDKDDEFKCDVHRAGSHVGNHIDLTKNIQNLLSDVYIL